MNKKHYEVVAAIIIKNNLILCTQRKISKLDYISLKFEFPGGKVEKGESNEQALTREIKEELDLEIKNIEYYLTINHEYPDFKLTMHCYKCGVNSTDLDLKEHVAYKWLNKNDLKILDWAAADVPIVNKLTIDQ